MDINRFCHTVSPNSVFCSSTLRIAGSKKQSEERAALFAVRVHAIVMHLLPLVVATHQEH